MTNVRAFMTISAGVSIASALALLVTPAQMGALFGITLDEIGVAQSRLLGAAYLGYAAIAWFARDVTDGAAVRAIALGSALSWAISAIVTLMAVATGLAGSQAWLLVAVEAAFAAAWASVAFRERVDHG